MLNLSTKGIRLSTSTNGKRIQLPPYDGVVNAFLDRSEWNFRIAVGDANEKFSLWFKPNEYAFGLAIYETKQAPSWQMQESFKLLSNGVNLFDVVTITFLESPNENRIKTASPKLARF